jgi:hypothetical protein
MRIMEKRESIGFWAGSMGKFGNCMLDMANTYAAHAGVRQIWAHYVVKCKPIQISSSA